jgi:GAF domain-containing protein
MSGADAALERVDAVLAALDSWEQSERLTDPVRVAAARRAASYVIPPDDELREVLWALQDRVPAAKGAIITFVEGDFAVSRVTTGIAEPFEMREVRSKLSICSAVVDQGAALLIDDAMREENFRVCVEDAGATRGYVGVPVEFDGKLVGAVALLGPEGSFTEETVNFTREAVRDVEAKIVARAIDPQARRDPSLV